MTPSVIVIGGGITGLVAAYEVRRRIPDAPITLLEQSGRLGGKLATEISDDGVVFEAGADSFLSRKPEGVALCEEIGLAERLCGRRPEHHRTYVLHRGTLHDLPSGLSGLIPTDLGALQTSSLLSREGKARVALEPEIPVRPGDADESIASFVSRRFGTELYQRMVEPLMAGIYAGDGEKLSLLATFPGLREMERRTGSILRGLAGVAPHAALPPHAGNGTTSGRHPSPSSPNPYPPFVSFPSGMTELTNALAARLDSVDVRLHSTARRITRDVAGFQIGLETGGTLAADRVIVTVPAYAAAVLLSSVDQELADDLAAIDYSSCATVNLCYAVGDTVQAPTGYGYVVPRIEESPVLACTFVSNKWPARAPAGCFVARVYVRESGNHPTIDGDDAQLVSLAVGELRRTLGFTGKPLSCRVHRWPRSMPQYTIGHVERARRIAERTGRHPGLGLAGAAYEGVGIPDCIRSGRRAAVRAADSVERKRRENKTR